MHAGSSFSVGSECPDRIAFNLVPPSNRMRAVTVFGKKGPSTKEGLEFNAVRRLCRGKEVVWLDCVSLEKHELEELRDVFGIDQIILDSCQSEERPGFETYENMHYVIFKTLRVVDEPVSKQINFILHKNLLITVRPHSETFTKLTPRVSRHAQRVRQYGSSYLLAIILDAIVDGYYYSIYDLDDRIDVIEDEVLSKRTPEVSSTPEVSNQLFGLHKNLTFIRKIIWPEIDVLRALEHKGIPHMHVHVKEVFADVRDHFLYIQDIVQSQMDIVNSIRETYYLRVSNELNHVMKILTILTAAVILPNLIGSLFGMNLPRIPTLDFTFVSLFTFLLFILSIISFRLIGWI